MYFLIYDYSPFSIEIVKHLNILIFIVRLCINL